MIMNRKAITRSNINELVLIGNKMNIRKLL